MHSCLFALLAGASCALGQVISGYYPSYNQAPSQVNYDKYSTLVYFVFTTTPDPATISQAGIPDSQIYDFVSRANYKNLPTTFSLGGYTGSQYFSTHVSNPTSRTTFARAIVAVMKKYSFYGVDIDWEYPGQATDQNNANSPNDLNNLILLIQTIRSLVKGARITYSAQLGGIIGSSGSYTNSLGALAAQLDYLTIMAYDVYGTWSPTTGPNNGLKDSCAPASNPYSITTGFAYYTGAGVPASKILLGMPAYNYAYLVSTPSRTKCTDRRLSYLYQPSVNPDGSCGPYYSAASPSQYLFRDIAAYRTNPSWTQYNESTQSSASNAMWQASSQTFINYDDGASFRTKAQWVKYNGLGGVNVFDTNGDTNDAELQNAILSVIPRPRRLRAIPPTFY